jgi:tetratricopeptide (TPR) repeat protein
MAGARIQRGSRFPMEQKMKPIVLLVAAVVGGLCGAFTVHFLGENESSAPARAVTRETTAQPAADLELRATLLAIDSRLADLEKRLAAGDSVRQGREAAAAVEKRPTTDDESASPITGGARPGWKAQQIVAEIVGKEMGSSEANRLFGRLTGSPDEIDETVKSLKELVAKDPKNPELQVALATALVAKLANRTAPGPQQGIVWDEAIKAYDAAIEVNPQHWQARFGKAFGTSMIPAFLGQRPAAIQQFEELRALQAGGAPEKHHVQTYFRLGQLYKDEGNVEKARSVWEEGLLRFPTDKTIKDALDIANKR